MLPQLLLVSPYVPTQPLKVPSGSPRSATFKGTLQGLQKQLPMVACNAEHTKNQQMVLLNGRLGCLVTWISIRWFLKIAPGLYPSSLTPWFSFLDVIPPAPIGSHRFYSFCFLLSPLGRFLLALPIRIQILI